MRRRTWGAAAVGDARLGAAATSSGADIVDKILGVTSVRGATVLGDGPLTGAAVDLLDTQSPTVAISAESAGAELAVRRVSDKVVMAPFDPRSAPRSPVSAPARSFRRIWPTLTPHRSTTTPGCPAADAVAAVLWRTLEPSVEPRTQILLPPLKWSPQPDDARAILSALANAMRGGNGHARRWPR